jgi:hypothetical protein
MRRLMRGKSRALVAKTSADVRVALRRDSRINKPEDHSTGHQTTTLQAYFPPLECPALSQSSRETPLASLFWSRVMLKLERIARVARVKQLLMAQYSQVSQMAMRRLICRPKRHMTVFRFRRPPSGRPASIQ